MIFESLTQRREGAKEDRVIVVLGALGGSIEAALQFSWVALSRIEVGDSFHKAFDRFSQASLPGSRHAENRKVRQFSADHFRIGAGAGISFPNNQF